MYNDTRYYEDTKTYQIAFPFNKNAFVGLCIATPLVLGLVFLLYFWKDIAPDQRAIEYNYVPIILLNFGSGDGTGQSKGNLSAEGVAHKGQNPATTLNDAEISTTTRRSNQESLTDPTQSSNIQPKTELTSTSNNTTNDMGNSTRNIGLNDGSIDGSGLGNRGRGLGLGDGFGDIEWGGGGNRIVLTKKPPRFPTGANISGEVKLKFIVKPDGTISKIMVLKKADPALENAAIEALRQWRFNPIRDTIDMEGIIPFKFKLK
ncbi:MAG: energy transducer TonB [Bacteroidetes bacterium]|nr:energy transducer TonB [Bacteroidota bacterium]